MFSYQLNNAWDPNSICNSIGDTALHLLVRHHRCEVAVHLLTEAKCDPNIENIYGIQPINLMLLSDTWSDSECISIIKCIVSSQSWDPNSSCDSSGNTALHLSVIYYNRYEIAHYLLSEVKCDPNIRNKDGVQLIELLMAEPLWSDSECIDIIKVLVSTGIWDPNSSCNSDGDTVLHLSVKCKRYKVALYLLSDPQVNCDPNIRNLDGETQVQLLFSFIIYGWSGLCIDMIKALISTNKWDHNSSCNSNGDTALHLLIKHHRYEATCLLLTMPVDKCDPYIKNRKGKTPILLLMSAKSWSDSECANIIKVLLSTGVSGLNLSCNSDGDTALHLSIKYHRYDVTHYLLSEVKCDPNVRNKDGVESIELLMEMQHWSDSECIDMIQVLMSTRVWDPNSSCNSDGDTIIHLSALYHRYELAHYLLSKGKCDPHLKGTQPIQLLMSDKSWSDPECIDMIKALLTGKWDPNSSCNSQGDTVLHLAARYHRPSVVNFLISEAKCIINITNFDEETPLQVADDSGIVNNLIRHGANPESVYKSLGKSVGLTKPLIPPVKVFIIGNSGVGKSTLTEALKIESSLLARPFTSRKKVSGVNEKTAGIVPHEFVSKLYGRVVFYDFAGQKEFYNSHIAILQNVIKSASPIFLVVVNLSNSETEVEQNIQYWLSFIKNNCNTAHSKPHVIVIGSHADVALNKGEDPQRIRTASKMSNYVKLSQDLTLEYVGMYAIDCRYPESQTMAKLRSCLKHSCKNLRISDTISFNAHCFHVFLLDKFRTSVAVTIDDLRMEMKKATDKNEKGAVNYLPDTITALNLVCDELNDRGHILFMKNNDNLEKSWVIIDKTSLLSKVTGTIFAPNDFKEHCQIAESTGVVPLSRLITNFPDYKSEVLIGFLTHLEFCHEINDRELHELISKHQDSLNKADAEQSENERYFLFPGLITLNAPRGIWKQNHNFQYHCFLIIQCTRQDQFFSSRFTQVLLLRLAFSFALIKKEIDQSIPALQRECSIWKNGIFWGEMFGMEAIVEIHSSKVILLMRCQEENILHCIAKRSSIIQKILKCVHDFCSNIETVESFIDPSEATEFPLKSPVSSETSRFSLQKIAEAIVTSTEYDSPSVVSSTGTISLDYLLTFEPYVELGIAALKKLCTSENDNEKEVSDSFLQRLSCKLSKKCKLFMKIFKSSSAPSHLSPTTSEYLFTKLKTWRDECDGTYMCLKQKLDQFSIFAGRNVLVSKLLSYVNNSYLLFVVCP